MNKTVYIVGNTAMNEPYITGVYEDYSFAMQDFCNHVKCHIFMVEKEFTDYINNDSYPDYNAEMQDTLDCIPKIKEALSREDYKSIDNNYSEFVCNLQSIGDFNIWEGDYSYFVTREINKQFRFHY